MRHRAGKDPRRPGLLRLLGFKVIIWSAPGLSPAPGRHSPGSHGSRPHGPGPHGPGSHGVQAPARPNNPIRPASLGQAGRISGIHPADLAVLLLYLDEPGRLTEVVVNSLIADPLEGADVDRTGFTITGIAWDRGSGIGRVGGRFALEQMTDMKTIVIEIEGA